MRVLARNAQRTARVRQGRVMRPDPAMAPLPFFDEAASWAAYDAAARALPASTTRRG